MKYEFPLDPKFALELVKRRGPETAKHLAVGDETPPDGLLARLAWAAGTGWFPRTAAGAWHGGLDVGLAEAKGEEHTFTGAKVRAIADGTVVWVEHDRVTDRHGFDAGRIIVEHATPDGETFYYQYRHVIPQAQFAGRKVTAGEILGIVGWHGEFPHVELSAASLVRIGSDEALVPEHARAKLPSGETVRATQRVAVDALERAEWPNPELKGKRGWVFHPLGLLMHCRKEEAEHLVGPGPRPMTLATRKIGVPIAAGAPATIHVPVLQSAALKAEPKLAAIATDAKAKPIEEGNAAPELLAALQRFLKAIGYAGGASGHGADDVDGAHGDATAKTVARFQVERVKPLAEEVKKRGMHGMHGAVRTDGAVDPKTLHLLDAHAKQQEKPRPKKQPAAAKRKEEPPPVLSAGDVVFDPALRPLGAESPGSLQMGIRMYGHLLDWLWDGKGRGVGYSTCAEKAAYGEAAGFTKAMNNEWPLLGIDVPVVKADVTGPGGASYRRVGPLWGLSWTESNFSNCCNSQLAALTCALGGKTFGVVPAARGAPGVHDIRRSGTPIAIVEKDGRKTTKGLLTAFESIFVKAAEWSRNGRPGLDPNLGGMASAVEFLGIGRRVFGRTAYGDKPKEFLKMRIGDLAEYKGHAWLVGDVRYGIWVEGQIEKEDVPDYLVDQSSFACPGAPSVLKMVGKEVRRIRATERDATYYGSFPTRANLATIAADEAGFEKRLTDFLASRTVTVDGGVKRVTSLKVVAWQVFSANVRPSKRTNVRQILHSEEWNSEGSVEEKNLRLTTKKEPPLARCNYVHNGITRRWDRATGNTVSLCRLYGVRRWPC